MITSRGVAAPGATPMVVPSADVPIRGRFFACSLAARLCFGRSDPSAVHAALSAEMRYKSALRITGSGVCRCIYTMSRRPVDLWWFGGFGDIGTTRS